MSKGMITVRDNVIDIICSNLAQAGILLATEVPVLILSLTSMGNSDLALRLGESLYLLEKSLELKAFLRRN